MNRISHLNLEITNLCNQRCLYCFNNSGPLRHERKLEADTWRKFLELQKKLGLESVHITGGEPFVDERTIELLGAAQDLGLRTSVLSNGYRIDRLIAQYPRVFERLAVVQVSLDSGNAAEHDARRGKVGAWAQAMRAILALRKIGVPCEVSCTVSEENGPAVKRLALFCDRWGLKLIVRRMSAFGRGIGSSLQPLREETLRATLQDIEADNPGVVVQDRFWYVPDGPSFDAEARRKGCATVLADGRFRGGAMFVPGMGAAFTSAPEMLAAA